MQFKLEKMILIFKDGGKRDLTFHDGVNIISGRSQTGKSALIDIIDYCLFSSNCTIPQGVIRKSVATYCIVVWINKKRLILARNEYNDSSNPGKLKIFYQEKSELFDDTLITKDFFNKNENAYISEKHFKKFIKILLGLTNEKLPLDDINDSVLSFRSMTSFMFQHQNLMANKYALFYRLDSFTRVKQTQRDLKIYMDIQNLNLLKIDDRLYEIKKELKQIEKDEKFINNKFDNLIKELKTDCIAFYGLHGGYESKDKISQISQFTNEDILSYSEIVKEIKSHGLKNNIPKELSKLEKIKDKLFKKINEMSMQLEDISQYEINLNSTKDILNINYKVSKETVCPLCNTSDSLNQDKYIQARDQIKEEILEIETLSPQILEEKENLQRKLENKKKNFRTLNSKFIQMRNKYKDLTSTEEKREELLKLKTEILAKQKFLNELKKFHNKEKEDLINEQKKLLDEKGSFDSSTKIKQIEVKISEYINEIIENGFSLENSLGNPNLYFDIEDFSLYQQLDSKKIYLSEMGSGSNWLNCHISLLLALHKYISFNDSKIPSFLFFDQPSQVYFPSEEDIKNPNNNDKESDLVTVKYILKKIIEHVDLINSNKNCKSKLQLFITDHVSFEEEWFSSHLIEDGIWSEGKKLVPLKYENENN